MVFGICDCLTAILIRDARWLVRGFKDGSWWVIFVDGFERGERCFFRLLERDEGG
jgi:hypothetical protein